MIRIEYRYPWARKSWNPYGLADRMTDALELLDSCRIEHPGSECRIQNDPVVNRAAE